MGKKITVFNRQAVYLGHDEQKAQLVMDTLTENDIGYRLKTEGMRNPVLSSKSFSRKEHTSMSLQQYIIYVYQGDFSRAKHVLRGIV